MDDDNIYLRYDDGTVIAEDADDKPSESFEWDDRIDKWRTLAMNYSDAVQQLKEEGVAYKTGVPRYRRANFELELGFDLHYYQKEALDAWIEADCRGSVILPTGSGKTYLALKAIEYISRSTLVIVPTIDLLNQWYDLLTTAFDTEIGLLGGGYHEIEEITVSTYDSAYIYCGDYGNRFAFLVFDEVHHLPAPKYSHIPQFSIASRRLGLTATYFRADGMHETLKELIGEVVYNKSIDDLSGEFLADYEIVSFYVKLTPQERIEYEREYDIYISFVRKRDLKLYGGGWREFARLSTVDPDARRAMLAYNRAKTIALSAYKKLKVLESLLKQHKNDRIIVFTENNDFVYQISEKHLIPTITHQTKTKERKRILERFNRGEYPVIATSKVLNEGINVPEANVAIVLSGSGSSREYTQRLGRILRHREGKYATLYELIAEDTMEESVSQRRRKKQKKKQHTYKGKDAIQQTLFSELR